MDSQTGSALPSEPIAFILDSFTLHDVPKFFQKNKIFPHYFRLSFALQLQTFGVVRDVGPGHGWAHIDRRSRASYLYAVYEKQIDKIDLS